ncbi:His/Gly/Thr/Pro-type tRNA ligase C-terminal domain-containing protein, partial [Brevundimonas sp.]
KFDPTIVRGLEYYTGTVFEAELLLETKDEKGRPIRFGSIGGGGRYDDLVARFTGQTLPATGFSFGVSRLAAALRSAGRSGPQTRGPVVVIVFSDDDMQHYLDAVSELRNAGIPAELYLGRAGMKAQFKYADRRGAPAAVILGGDEIAAGEVTIKDLDAGRAQAAAITNNEEWKAARPGQMKVARSELVSVIKSIIE